MSIDETNAFLNQLMIPQNIVSPSKQPTNPLIDEKLMELVRNSLHYGQPTLHQTVPQTIPQLPVSIQTSVQNELNGDHMLKASPSASSDMSSSPDCEMADQQMMNMHQNSHFPQTPLQQLNIDSPANIAANNEQKSCGGRFETWLECFNTTKLAEYEALLFSVYVSERAERKYDGWTYFDCLHRLQSKCRYRVRAKKQDEFYIVEEKGVHNHGAVEPVGQAGSHAGLPKTIREIVDRSYNESWPLELRTVKVDEEIKRLGLPENPRLGRQIDNRVAYLRRVKNLNETRRIQDQVNGSIDDPAMLAEAMMNAPSLMDLQALMDKNGGSLTVEKGLVEKLLGPEALAELVAKQETENQDQPGDPKDEENQSIAKPVAMNPTPDFLQFLQQQHQALGQDQDHAAIILAKAQQNLMGAQENIPHDSNQESSHFAQAHQNLLQAQQSIPQVNMQHNLMGAQENIPN